MQIKEIGIGTTSKDIKFLFKDITNIKIEKNSLEVTHLLTSNRYNELKKMLELDKSVELVIKIDDMVIEEAYSINDYSININEYKIGTITAYLGRLYLFNRDKTTDIKIDYDVLTNEQLMERQEQIRIEAFGLLPDEAIEQIAKVLNKKQ